MSRADLGHHRLILDSAASPTRQRLTNAAIPLCCSSSSVFSPSCDPQTRVAKGPDEDPPPTRSTRPVLFTGRKQILQQLMKLEDLALRSGQDGAASGLAHFIVEEYASRKIPHLICFFADEDSPGEERRLVGAVLAFEYLVAGFRTGFVATGDSFGVRTVFGSRSNREEIAIAACQALIGRGARIVLVSLKQEATVIASTLPPAGSHLYQWARAEREVQDSMNLGCDLDETLGRLGKRTRTRLRASRRRFDQTMQAEFIPNAIGTLPLESDAFLSGLNRNSLDPIGQATFNLQLRSTAQLPGGFVCGIRSAEFGWLALLGGWRQGRTTWVEWQVNLKGFEKLSLGSVLRTYLLEDEIARGTRKLGFHGSTSHSMAHSFGRERVVDLLVRRRSLAAFVLVHLIPLISRVFPAIGRRGNFLANALATRDLQWTATMPQAFRSPDSN